MWRTPPEQWLDNRLAERRRTEARDKRRRERLEREKARQEPYWGPETKRKRALTGEVLADTWAATGSGVWDAVSSSVSGLCSWRRNR